MKFFLQLFLLFTLTNVYAYPDHIKTVQCYPLDEPFGEPVIELGSRRQLMFSFDDLSPEVNNYSYKIIHCDPDWKPSNISLFQYLSGFNIQQFTDYKFSFNTEVDYTHYSLLIPNEDMELKLSGNYMLQVINDDYPDSIVISQPFALLENRVSISAHLKTPNNPRYVNSSHELGFTISHDNVYISNPMRDVKVYVTQNQDVNSRRDFTPTFVRPNQLVYGDGLNNIFNGLAPFRNFQVFSTVYYTQYVKNIIQDDDNIYHVVLQPGRAYSSYVPLPGFKGSYVIGAERVGKAELEAEYIFVHFAVYSKELSNADVYIYGKFSNWQLSPDYRMRYDEAHQAYVGEVMVKQGNYDYMYAVLPRGSKQPDLVTLQGNFQQTRNDYNIRCYLHDYQLGYYRLVGYTTLVD